MSALLSVASTLLGGMLGQNSERRNNEYQRQLIQEQNAYNAPDKVRERAEAAGFNPLLFVGPGVGQQTATAASSSSNYMGNAIADAGLLLADAVAKRKDAMRLSQMEDQNRRLSDRVQSLTLRPQVGGIYAQNERTPTLASALGVLNAVAGQPGAVAGGAVGAVVSGSGGNPALRPLAETLPTDPRRGVDNKAQATTSGLMVVDNPAIPFPWYVPSMDGDEAMTLGEAPVAAVSLAASYLYDQWQRSKGAGMLHPTKHKNTLGQINRKQGRVIGSNVGLSPPPIGPRYGIPLPFLKYPHVPKSGLSWSDYATGGL